MFCPAHLDMNVKCNKNLSLRDNDKISYHNFFYEITLFNIRNRAQYIEVFLNVLFSLS